MGVQMKSNVAFCNRDNSVKELKEQLQVPIHIEIVTVERKLLIQYDGTHANKRTKLRGKLS